MGQISTTHVGPVYAENNSWERTGSVQMQTDLFRHTQNQLTEIPHCKPTRNLQQSV